ncbi:MAG: dicarboxylate/amino acid:cation symporter [Tidjanibacter sp.]|nr:dicarboxylate/amino acid:cation symporter [Tidjanibacter sp.]
MADYTYIKPIDTMKLKKLKIGLLPKIIIAIALGIVCGLFFPDPLTRVFITINSLFGNFLSFIIPLLIIGLIVPGIADIGHGAGRLVLITAALAYSFTLFSGFFTFGACEQLYPWLLRNDSLLGVEAGSRALAPYFTVEMPPVMNVMSALLISFVLGIGITMVKGERLKNIFDEFKDIIVLIISRIIIPLLPLYIFGIFLTMTVTNQVAGVMSVFLKLIVMIFGLTVVLLLIQFSIAGIVARKNPLKLLKNMLTAYVTALGTQSSAATIPVTLEQTIKNGVRPAVAGFVVPLCATIHLSGSTMKITACALAIMMLSNMPVDPLTMIGFIFMLGITMVAAPGVPGGAIMASIGILQSILGFDETAIGLMIALYIAMDSFGTATNVTGDGAIAVIMNKISK